MLGKQIPTASFKNYHISLTADDEYLIISSFTVTQNQIKEIQELDEKNYSPLLIQEIKQRQHRLVLTDY